MKQKPKSEQFQIEIQGKTAMFLTPQTKLSCERMSYPFPTYSALVGIMNSIYSRPGIVWVIDRIRVINPISFVSLGQIMPNYKMYSKQRRDRFNYVFLENVKYEIDAHYELDYHREDISHCNFKHGNAIRYAIRYQTNRLVKLGKTGCYASVKPIEFGKQTGYYDKGDIGLNQYMFYRFRRIVKESEVVNQVGFRSVEMRKGIIDFNSMKSKIYWRDGFDYYSSSKR